MDQKAQFSTSATRCPPTRKRRRTAPRDPRADDAGPRRHQAVGRAAQGGTSDRRGHRVGPATVEVNDGGAGIRFNFPSAARFRPITWEEWFENFDANGLTFVYEEEVADRAYEFYQRRGGEHGHDQDDWFEAERQLHKPGAPSARYRLIKE